MKLRAVTKQEWKLEPNVDSNGFTKVGEMDGFKFVFVDSTGKYYDLRPTEGKPCAGYLNTKSEKELHKMLITAYKKQIEELTTGEKYSAQDSEIIRELEQDVKLVENNLKRLN